MSVSRTAGPFMHRAIPPLETATMQLGGFPHPARWTHHGHSTVARARRSEGHRSTRSPLHLQPFECRFMGLLSPKGTVFVESTHASHVAGCRTVRLYIELAQCEPTTLHYSAGTLRRTCIGPGTRTDSHLRFVFEEWIAVTPLKEVKCMCMLEGNNSVL